MLSLLQHLHIHNHHNIYHEDIRTGFSFDSEDQYTEVQLVATFRIGSLVRIGLCAAGAFLVWFLRRRKRRKKETAELRAAAAKAQAEGEGQAA